MALSFIVRNGIQYAHSETRKMEAVEERNVFMRILRGCSCRKLLKKIVGTTFQNAKSHRRTSEHRIVPKPISSKDAYGKKRKRRVDATGEDGPEREIF